jgi:hypothetical protein
MRRRCRLRELGKELGIPLQGFVRARPATVRFFGVGALKTAEMPFWGNTFIKASWRACHGRSCEINLSTSVLIEKVCDIEHSCSCHQHRPANDHSRIKSGAAGDDLDHDRTDNATYSTVCEAERNNGQTR